MTKEWSVGAKGAWEINRAHFPTPLSAWMQDILPDAFRRGFSEGTARLGLLLDYIDHRFANGFDYNQPVIVGAPRGAKGPPPKLVFKVVTRLHPKVRRRLATLATAFERKPWRDDVREFEEVVRPASTATHLALQAIDPATLDDAALVAHLQKLYANAQHQYYLHHRFTVSVTMPVGDYIAHVEEWTGLSAGEVIQACKQPRGVVTVASEQMAALVAALRDSPLATTAPDELLAALATDRGPAGIAARAYREMTDHRLVTGYDFTDLTAAELPALLVRTIHAGLAGVAPQSATGREKAMAKIRDRVPDKHRAAYDELHAEACSVSNLREERALVCDFWAFGIARRALKELGTRLATRGAIDAADHVFDATLAEQLALVADPHTGPSRAELAQRNAWRHTATADDAPLTIGGEPTPPPPIDWFPVAARRGQRATEAILRCLFVEPGHEVTPRLVRGLNASAGIYEGRARVVLRPDQFPRIEQGDVLIARSTTEAYNGIIPLLGAVVTDRGGVLSHAATVAREFGIPAVVGCGSATQTIPDGARVRVDGDRGEARIL